MRLVYHAFVDMLTDEKIPDSPELDHSFLVALEPPPQGLGPFLSWRKSLRWSPFREALPPLLPLCSLDRAPKRGDLRQTREALRGGFGLTGVFSRKGESWLEIAETQRLQAGLSVLLARAEARQVEGILPSLVGVYLGPGEASPERDFVPWRQEAWLLRVYEIMPTSPDPRRGFRWELLYDRPVPKTSARADASQSSPKNL